MEEVLRNGKMMLVPRKISDHIPTVPIHSTDRFIVLEWNENLGKIHYNVLPFKAE